MFVWKNIETVDDDGENFKKALMVEVDDSCAFELWQIEILGNSGREKTIEDFVSTKTGLLGFAEKNPKQDLTDDPDGTHCSTQDICVESFEN